MEHDKEAVAVSDTSGNTDRRDMERLLAFDTHVASMVTAIGYSARPVVFTVEIASEAAELVHFGHQTPTEIQQWAFALLQRRDVLFEPGWSVPLLGILERYAFGGEVEADAENWRRTFPALEPQPPSAWQPEESRRELLELTMDVGEPAGRAIQVLREVGQEGVTRPIYYPDVRDFARKIQNALDGFIPLESLREWALFVLGRRDIGFRSAFDSQQIVWVLVDCMHVVEASDPEEWLDASVTQLWRVQMNRVADDADAGDDADADGTARAGR